ncbi:MAG: aspartyl protease family protein [Deltaproteobacteria bacterium]|nr:aspartyl protease family protein [Deltaproteobacteria bacterium]
MGLTTVRARVGRGRRALDAEFLVDSGASYTVLPEPLWRKLGLRSIATRTFGLADGSTVDRRLSETWFEYGGEGRTVQVVLGERGDEALLGVLTLEAFGLMLNPFRRELVPMRLLMA